MQWQSCCVKMRSFSWFQFSSKHRPLAMSVQHMWTESMNVTQSYTAPCRYRARNFLKVSGLYPASPAGTCKDTQQPVRIMYALHLDCTYDTHYKLSVYVFISEWKLTETTHIIVAWELRVCSCTSCDFTNQKRMMTAVTFTCFFLMYGRTLAKSYISTSSSSHICKRKQEVTRALWVN